MRRALARSFVITLSASTLGACNRNEPATTTTSATPTTTTATPSARPTASTTATHKRRRTQPLSHDARQYADGFKYSDFATQNPTDSQGRVLYVAPEDDCYVEMPMKPPYPPMPSGARYVTSESVDCPAVFDDAAWDQCPSSTLVANKTKTGDCYCVPLGGNPPAPPVRNACPATIKQ
jgi:hypothetical protein